MSRASQRRKRSIHWWNRGSGIRLRIWMLVNALLLTALTLGVYTAVSVNAHPVYQGLGTGSKPPGLLSKLVPKSDAIPTKQQFLKPDGVYFGAATKQAPFSTAEVQQVTKAAGAAPSMTEYFVDWTHAFDPKAVTAAYKHGTLPVISWEPWAGGSQNAGALPGTISQSNVRQPRYRLANIAGGDFDSYITAFAQGVAAAKWPVVIRFAHEMNGTWYPWAEKVNGNRPGDYVKAWRHVHDLFTAAGATNVIWLWSPNIIRPVPHTALGPLYPGDAYVDWVGLTGYGVREASPDQTFDPTLKALAKVTAKPVLLAETGSQPGQDKAGWVAGFFPWLKKNPKVIGFIWTEKNQQSGALTDWRFDADPKSLSAFDAGLPTLTLAKGLGAPGS